MSIIIPDAFMDGGHDIGWLILTFMQIKESEQFRDRYINDIDSQGPHRQIIYKEEQELNERSIEFYDNRDEDEDQVMTRKFESFNRSDAKIWRNIEELLAGYEDNSEYSLVFTNYTKILEMHIRHKIFVDVKCFRSFVHCYRPHVVQTLFERDLIDPMNKVRIEEYGQVLQLINELN